MVDTSTPIRRLGTINSYTLPIHVDEATQIFRQHSVIELDVEGGKQGGARPFRTGSGQVLTTDAMILSMDFPSVG